MDSSWMLTPGKSRTDEKVGFFNFKNSDATHTAYFKDGTDEDVTREVQNALVVIIGYDNDRPLTPDIENLKLTYEKYKWPMLVIRNLDKTPLLSFLSSEEGFKLCTGVCVDLLIVHVLAHGTSNGVIFTHNEDEELLREELVEKFNAMEFLHHRRKLFLFGSCRGNKMEKRFNVGNRQNNSEDDSEEKSSFIQYDAYEFNNSYYFATKEGHFAINEASNEKGLGGGTDLVKAWCNALTSLSEDLSLETVITESNRLVYDNSHANMSSRTFVQTPVAHFSSCERQLFFSKLCPDHRKLRCCSTVRNAPSQMDVYMEPTTRIRDYSNIPTLGWYRDRNDDFSKRGPGRVYLFHDDAHTNKMNILMECFKDSYPHMNLRSILLTEDNSMADELERIAEIMEHEYVLHVFFLTKIVVKGKKVSLPRFGVENVDNLIKYFIAESCPFMCGKPKAFYFLDGNIGTDAKEVDRKVLCRNSGNNYTDVLCFIAKGKDIVEQMVSQLSSHCTELIEEKTHILDVLAKVTNSLEYSDGEFVPLTISTLRNRLSFIKVDPIYIKPTFQDESINLSYDEIIKLFLKTLRIQENKSAFVICSEAGTGKTRFANEVKKYMKDNRIVVVHIKAKEHERFFSYNRDISDVVKELNNGREVIFERAALILDVIDEICPQKRETIMSFLEKVVEKFLLVLATARPQEEEHITEALADFKVTSLKIKELHEDDLEEFMKMHLRDVKNGADTWNTLRQKINLTWTPQLLKLFAEYIRTQENKQSSQEEVTNKFQIFWNIFHERLMQSKKTLPNVDLLDVKIVNLKAAICYLLEKRNLMLDEEKIMVERVGLAYFVGDTVTFTHQSWAEFFASMAFLAPKGMLLNEFSLKEKYEILTTRLAVLEYLNLVFRTDLNIENNEFNADNLLNDEDLSHHLNKKKNGSKVLNIICKKNLRNMYFEYSKRKMLNILQGNGIETNKFLYSACSSDDFHNNNGEIALDLIENRGADLKRVYDVMCKEKTRKTMVVSLVISNNYTVLGLLQKMMSQELKNEALFEAAKLGHIESVKVLLDNGAKVEAECGGILQTAALLGNEKLMEYLLTRTDMDVNMISKGERNTALHVAVQARQLKIVKWLLDQEETDFYACSADGRNALNIAVDEGNVEMIELMLERGFDVDSVEQRNGFTSLHSCVVKNSEDAVSLCTLLLQNGADIKKTDKDGRTCLHLAVNQQCLEMVTWLLQKEDVNINAKDNNGQTALYLAVLRNYSDAVQVLLDRKADVNKADENIRVPLHIAAENGFSSVLKLLLKERKVRIQAIDIFKLTALHVAAFKEKIDTLEILLQAGADINTIDIIWNTPLHLAANFGRVSIVERLIKEDDLQINKRNKSGQTALLCAANYGHVRILELLLEAKADVKKADFRKHAVLHYAASGMQNKLLQRLINERSLNVNAQNKFGMTALHMAVVVQIKEIKEKHEFIKLLLSREDIDVGLRTMYGKTARELTQDAEIILMLNSFGEN